MDEVFHKVDPDFCQWIKHMRQGAINKDSVNLFKISKELNITGE